MSSKQQENDVIGSSSTQKAKSIKVIAEVSISPRGTESSSLSKYIKKAVRILHEDPRIEAMTTPMCTIIQADTLDIILEVVKRAHESLFEEGIPRVVTTIKIDDRRDKPRDMSDKIKSVLD